ncbi:Putative uncharacterized protein Yba3 [Buchnera aphidicola (Pterocallis alni)]|uniref:hypothetical protein n=1 Tax=Buchnera aphidicola TaxID=9 RepID=UPI003463D669
MLFNYNRITSNHVIKYNRTHIITRNNSINMNHRVKCETNELMNNKNVSMFLKSKNYETPIIYSNNLKYIHTNYIASNHSTNISGLKRNEDSPHDLEKEFKDYIFSYIPFTHIGKDIKNQKYDSIMQDFALDMEYFSPVAFSKLKYNAPPLEFTKSVFMNCKMFANTFRVMNMLKDVFFN